MVTEASRLEEVPLGMVTAAAGAEKAFVAEKNIAMIRLAVVAHGTLVYHFVMNQAGTIQWLAYLLLAIAWMYGLYVYFFEPYRRYPVMLSSYFTSVSDVIFTTGWLYATGGVHSPFYVVLYGSVIAIAFRYSYRETIIAAVIYSISYLALLASLGQLAGYGTEISVRIGYLALIAATGALFAREALHQTRAKLELQDLAQRLNTEVQERTRMETELAEAHRRLAESREKERLQLAQELHDGPVQDLYGARFQLKELGEALYNQTHLACLDEVQVTLQHVIQTLRTICGELRPPALAPFGLEVAIRSHATEFQKAHPEIEVKLDLARDRQALPERVRLALFRIYQQALNNVAQHARAHSVLIQVALEAEQVVLTIQDDGDGFVVPVHWLALARRGHLGLLGSAERAEAIGGRMEVVAAVGQGTMLRVAVPHPARSDIVDERKAGVAAFPPPPPSHTVTHVETIS